MRHVEDTEGDQPHERATLDEGATFDEEAALDEGATFDEEAAPDEGAKFDEEAALDGEEAGTDTAPRGFEGWRRQSALGAVGTGVARGLQAVFAPPANQPVVAAEAPGDPPGRDDRLRVILDPDDPSKSVAIVPDPERPGPDEGSPR